MKNFFRILIAVLLFGIVLVLANYAFKILNRENGIYTPTNTSNTQPDNSNAVPLQQVNNLGYTFYVGQIDNTNTDITDDLKNQITKIVYDAKFPESLLKNIPIVIVNSLSVTPNLYIQEGSNRLLVGSLNGEFLYEEGYYETYTDSKSNTMVGSVIYINKTYLTNSSLTEILTHELGHAIGAKLTSADWKEFYSLRNIPVGTLQETSNWNLSPAEDFAEVYKNTFTGITVKTFYGILLPSGYDPLETTCGNVYDTVKQNILAEDEKTNTPENNNLNSLDMLNYFSFSTPPTASQTQQAENSTNANTEVQNCRREVMANPNKYPNDFKYGVPYISTVNQKTKDFINTILKRFN